MTTALFIGWVLLPLLVLGLIVLGVMMLLEVEPWFWETRGLGCFTIIVALVLVGLLVF
jgi:hypothetical protein